MAETDHLQDPICRTAFFTGHRILNEEEKKVLPDHVFRCLSEAYEAGFRRFYCGCALGFDTIAAYQTIRLRELHPDVSLLLAIPCATQADRWPEQDRLIYDKILENADSKEILSPVYYQGAMLTRNRYMADRSSLCICYLRYMRGGTASTVRYALLQNRIRIINLAVGMDLRSGLLRENAWNYTFISPSANKNAGIVHLRPSSGRKLIMKSTST